MSYSFVAISASPEEVLLDISARLKAVVDQQPVHKAELPAVEKAAIAFVKAMPKPSATQHLEVAIAGSVSGPWKDGTMEHIGSVQTNIHVRLVDNV